MSETRKVVINACHGGFNLSAAGTEAYMARKGQQVWWFATARNAAGAHDYNAPKVPTQAPDEEFIAYAYTTPNPADGSLFSDRDIQRDDPDLVAIVEQMGDRAAGNFARLAVIEIPADVDWAIEEYDGREWIAERHRTWGYDD